MAVTTPTPRLGRAAPGEAPAALRARSRPAAGLLIALVVACAYAAFARGATEQPDEARLQVLLAALALVAAGLWSARRLEVAGRRAALAGVALLAGLAAWNGISLLWSVAPDATWAELNRWLAYALVCLLGLAAASSVPRAVERLAAAWLVAATVVALYALATKLVPGVHLLGVNFDQEVEFSRLRTPLDYWNALALWCVLAVPVALRFATERTLGVRTRTGAALALSVLLTVGALTYSRGGVLAVLVALAVLIGAGTPRLRGLAVLGLAAAASAPAVAYAFTSHALTTDGTPLGSREVAGGILAAFVAVPLAGLALLGPRLVALEARGEPSPARSRAVWRGLAAAAAALCLIGVLALAVSHRGLTGSIGHQVHQFTTARKDPITDPSRLLSTSSGNRWVWWKEAAGAWWSRPLGGWGAGSFPVTHLIYRRSPPLPVAQPHSVLLQLLAETGIVGALLGVLAVALLLRAAVDGIRARAPGRERELAIALLAAAVAWVVHGFFDWDTDFPAVTLPVVLFLGALGALPAGRRPRPAVAGPGAGWGRAAVLGLLSLLLCAAAVSAILPSWSQTHALGALGDAAGASSDAGLARAQEEADLASRVDPLSVAPLYDAATIAERRGRALDVRNYLQEAVGREPYDAIGWERLALFALSEGDARDGLRAARRAQSLDPLNAIYTETTRLGLSLLTPAGDSATATGTPLAGPATVAPAPVPGAAPGSTAAGAARAKALLDRALALTKR